MTSKTVVAICAAVALVVVVIRIAGPWSRGIWKRSRMHGPVIALAPGFGGTWVGWVLSLFWSMGEQIREETYEYLRPTLRLDPTSGEGVPEVTWEPTVADVTIGLPPSADQLPRDRQELSEHGRVWWSGREWVSTSRFVPPAAPRSEDGSHWWDGAQWRWVPGEWLPRATWGPRNVAVHQSPVHAAEASWIVDQRRHLNSRWIEPLPAPPQRSDPPPPWIADYEPDSMTRTSGKLRNRSA